MEVVFFDEYKTDYITGKLVNLTAISGGYYQIIYVVDGEFKLGLIENLDRICEKQN